MEFKVVLNQAIKIRDQVWPAKEYRVPEDMNKSLADWLLAVRSDIAKRVGQPIELSPPAGLGDNLERKDGNLVKEASPSEQKTAFERLVELVGYDYIEVFAPAGYGKSRLLAHIALETKRTGKKVLYLDCEHSLSKHIEKELGESYQRLDFMNLDKIIDKIATLPKGLSAVFYDSVGFPIMIQFVKMNLHERGNAIAKTILLRGYLKHYAEVNNALAIATNQPVSELYVMSHELDDIEHRPPVGGKSIHIAKAVLRMAISRQTANESIFELRAFECQDLPFNKLLATFTINEAGEKLEWEK